jgi:hypothetical protein
MKTLVRVYLGWWNHRVEIEIIGTSRQYDGLYDGILLDEEIEKMASWNVQEAPPHPDWLSSNTFQSTGKTFGLIIDPVSITVYGVNTNGRG